MVGNRKFRTFNVIDDCTREALVIDVDTSLSSKRIIRTLEKVIAQRGAPNSISSDSGPEFTRSGRRSKEFQLWCEDKKIVNQFIQR